MCVCRYVFLEGYLSIPSQNGNDRQFQDEVGSRQECLSWLLDVQKQLGDQRPTKDCGTPGLRDGNLSQLPWNLWRIRSVYHFFKPQMLLVLQVSIVAICQICLPRPSRLESSWNFLNIPQYPPCTSFVSSCFFLSTGAANGVRRKDLEGGQGDPRNPGRKDLAAVPQHGTGHGEDPKKKN